MRRFYQVIGLCILVASFASSQTEISGSITTNTVWDTQHHPYIVNGSIVVENGATLTVRAGTIVKMTGGTAFSVNGTLDVQGTAGSPVVFTSIYDDNYGGDTNGDLDATSPSPGDWACIYFDAQPGVSNTFDYCVVKYGGYYEGKMLIVNSSDPSYPKVTIDHCQLSKSAGTGIFVEGYASPLIHLCDLFDNTGFGVTNEGTGIVDARNSYCGL